MKSYSQLTRTWLPLMVLVAITSTALAQPKIGLIDLKKTFDSYWMTKQQNAELKESEAEYEKSRRRLLDDYQRAGDEYKKLLESANDQALSADERAKRKSDAERKVLEIREIEQSITTFDRTARQTLEDQTRRIRDRILVKIREVIDTQARSGGYTMVLDTAAVTVNQTPMILYHNGQNDLTDTVLTELNATAPISLPTPATPAPAPAPAIKRP
jgi:Skp family chaperone for outer membrane proteins